MTPQKDLFLGGFSPEKTIEGEVETTGSSRSPNMQLGF